MSNPEPPAEASPPQVPDVVASRLQARFEDRADEASAWAPTPSVRAERATAPPRAPARGSSRSADQAAQRQLDDLARQLTVLREQLDAAFDELEERLEVTETRACVAEARASVAETRASVAEARAADAELRANEALDVLAQLEARLAGDADSEGGATGGNLRSAIDRLRGRLDASS